MRSADSNPTASEVLTAGATVLLPICGGGSRVPKKILESSTETGRFKYFSQRNPLKNNYILFTVSNVMDLMKPQHDMGLTWPHTVQYARTYAGATPMSHAKMAAS